MSDMGKDSEVDSASSSVLLRPPPPLAKRLNRNALTVAAALAGVTVLTVLILSRPSPPSTKSAGASPGDAAPPSPARPAFLDQPPHVLGRQTPDTDPTGAAPTLPVPPPLRSNAVTVPAPGDLGYRDDQSASVSPRRQAYQAALSSGVVVGQAGPSRERSDQAGDVEPVPPLVSLAARSARPANMPTGVPESLYVGGEVASAGIAPRGESLSTSLSSAASAVGLHPSGTTPLRLDSAGSPYTIRAGTVIPALLLTGVNSDLPGEVLGQTSRDVYDSRTQRVLLVPSGSRLIGSYDNRLVGTGRLVVSWTRLILPDGRSMTLPRLAATDVQGQAGLHDGVDHHYRRVYGAALLTSLLTAGVQLSQPQQSGLYGAPSARQIAAGALGQTMGDVVLESTRRGLDVLPTVVIRPGQPFNVFLSGDVAFAGPYVPSGGPEGP